MAKRAIGASLPASLAPGHIVDICSAERSTITPFVPRSFEMICENPAGTEELPAMVGAFRRARCRQTRGVGGG
jgi:hypothetical protein